MALVVSNLAAIGNTVPTVGVEVTTLRGSYSKAIICMNIILKRVEIWLCPSWEGGYTPCDLINKILNPCQELLNTPDNGNYIGG